jgi:type II secretory pathway component PulF
LSDLTFFNEQLAALTKAGLPLEQGLQQLASDVGSRKLKRLLLDLAQDLAAGTPLPQALQRQQQRFPAGYPDVVAAGLSTGDLGGTLYGLTTHLRLKSGFRRILIEIVTYPLVVLALAFYVSSFLMRYVVPLLADMFADLRAEGLPGRRVPEESVFLFRLAGAWPVVELVFLAAVSVLLFLLFVAVFPGARGLREWLLRRVPGVAQVYWASVLARFTHTTALAAYTGTPLPELLAAGGAACGSPALLAASRRVAERLTHGAALDQAVAGERDIPPLWTCAVQAAAPRGDLPGALAELARTFELRAQQHANAVRTVLGPLLFLLMAIMIGGLIASLFSVFNVFLRGVMSLTWF